MGNHDYKPRKIVKNCLKDTEIILLENKSYNLTINNQKLQIAGIKDFWHFPDTKIEKIIDKSASCIILLSHNPDVFPKVPRKISLTLSGHTHGGDIILPFAGSPFSPSKYGQRYNKGYIIENGKHLFVTSGVATTSHFKFLNPPEIVFLTLYKETSAQEDTKPKKGIKKNYQGIYTKIARRVIFWFELQNCK